MKDLLQVGHSNVGTGHYDNLSGLQVRDYRSRKLSARLLVCNSQFVILFGFTFPGRFFLLVLSAAVLFLVFAASGRLLLGFGGLFIAFGAIVGLIETRALEDNPPTGADPACHRGVAVAGAGVGFLEPASGRLGDRLEELEYLPALAAFIVVRWHANRSL